MYFFFPHKLNMHFFDAANILHIQFIFKKKQNFYVMLPSLGRAPFYERKEHAFPEIPKSKKKKVNIWSELEVKKKKSLLNDKVAEITYILCFILKI